MGLVTKFSYVTNAMMQKQQAMLINLLTIYVLFANPKQQDLIVIVTNEECHGATIVNNLNN